MSPLHVPVVCLTHLCFLNPIRIAVVTRKGERKVRERKRSHMGPRVGSIAWACWNYYSYREERKVGGGVNVGSRVGRVVRTTQRKSLAHLFP